MRNTDIGKLIQNVANLGVLVGIAFLVMEIRQNTNSMQAATYQALVSGTTSFLENAALDPNLLSFVLDVAADPDQISDLDRLRLVTFYRAQWFRQQAAYQHWLRGSLHDEDWRAYSSTVCSGAFTRTQSMVWPQLKRGFLPEFVEYVEACRPGLAAAAR